MTIIRTLLAASRWLRHTWEEIKEPRNIKIIYWCAYWVSMTVGVGTLMAPPRTIVGEIGKDLTLSWSLLFIIGGVIGAASIFGGWWKYERLGLACIGGGLGVYATVVTYLHFVAEGSRITQIGMIAFAALLWVLRLTMIWARDYEPKERTSGRE